MLKLLTNIWIEIEKKARLLGSQPNARCVLGSSFQLPYIDGGVIYQTLTNLFGLHTQKIRYLLRKARYGTNTYDSATYIK